MIVRRSVMAGHFVVLAALFALFVSGATLNYMGFNYSTDVSSGGLKLHPYTFLTVAAVLILISGPNSLSRCIKIAQFRIGTVGALLTLGVVALKVSLGEGQSLGFAVDTLVAAFLVVAVLPVVSSNVGRRLSTIAMVFLVVECALATIEALAHINLIPIDVWYGAYFRATALHGHPLNNALIVVTVATALQSNARRWLAVSIFFLTTSALVAFGARGALMAYLLLNAINFIRYGLQSGQRMVVLTIGGAMTTAGLSWLVFSGVIGERISQVGAYDNSSEARLQALDIVKELNWSQIMIGNGSSAIARLMDQANVGVIENFLVGYLLTFGCILTAAIFYCVFCVCKALLAKVTPLGRWNMLGVIFVFSCTAMTNNSLITKTPALYLLMIGLWFARRPILPSHVQIPTKRRLSNRPVHVENQRNIPGAIRI